MRELCLAVKESGRSKEGIPLVSEGIRTGQSLNEEIKFQKEGYNF